MKNADRAGRLAALLRYIAGGGSLVRAAEYHGVRGYLQEFPELCSFGTGSGDNQRYRVEQSAFALKIAGFQEVVGGLFRAHGIRFLGLKGLSLSQLLHGDICRREFGDLDVLVAPEDARGAIKLLEDHGFVKTYPHNFSPSQNAALIRYGKAQNLYHQASSLSLDLHWRLVSAWIGHDLCPFEDLWARSCELARQGMTPWRTLGPEDTLVFLALHGFQDGFPRIKQLLDLSLALDGLDYQLEHALRIAGPRAGLVERAVEMVDWLLGSGGSGVYFSGESQAREAWAKMATRERTPQSELLRYEFWSCSAPEALGRSLRAMLTPALDDLGSVSLPPPLIGLYPLVRVFRLIGKAVSRSWPTVQPDTGGQS